ncbi:ABC transporter substrate-binding protein [Spirochaetia bacterium]|nr:ABC transporter substrate-binding protein [Spirochaetia bacterium]
MQISTKKPLVLMVTAFLLCAVLFSVAGCKKTDSGSTQVTVNALFMKQAGYSESDVGAITEQFQKDHPNIKITQTWVAYEELQPKILASAGSGGYDIFPGDCIWTAQFAQAGLAKDLSDKVKTLNLSDVWQGSLDAITYQGKYYGLPWLNDVKYLFYNKRMLRDAGFNGPPKTWDELQTQAAAIKAKGLVTYPIAWCWSQAEALICDYTAVSGGFGGRFVDQNGNPTLDTAQNKAALDFMYGTIKSGLTNPQSLEMLEDDVLGTFVAGSAAFALNWTYMFNSAQDPSVSSVVGDVGIAAIPGTAAAKSATVNGGMSLMISSGSKNVDAAWEYMLYLSSQGVQAEYSKDALPIWKSLFDNDTVINTNPDIVPVAKVQYGYLVNRPMVPYYGQLSTAMQVEIQSVLLGSQSSDAALKNIQSTAEKLKLQ